jgi:hypothetical protein
MILAAQNNLFEILIFTNCFVKFFTIFWNKRVRKLHDWHSWKRNFTKRYPW